MPVVYDSGIGIACLWARGEEWDEAEDLVVLEDAGDVDAGDGGDEMGVLGWVEEDWWGESWHCWI